MFVTGGTSEGGNDVMDRSRSAGGRQSKVSYMATAALLSVALIGGLSGCAAGKGSRATTSSNTPVPAPSSTAPTANGVSTTSPSSSTTAPPAATMLAAGTEGSRDQVPWSMVGAGWLLAQWSSKVPTGSGPFVSNLYLVDPRGGRYNLGAAPPGAVLSDWSGDGSRALLVAETSGAATATPVFIYNLRDGSVARFTVSGQPFPLNVRFSRPSGQAVLIPGENTESGALPAQRFALTGSLELAYPTSYPGAGNDYGSFAESPDGAALIFQAANGMELVNNSGQPLRFLAPPPGQTPCNPVRWWNDSEVLAFCSAQLWLIPVSGAPASPLTSATSPGSYLNAWSLPGGDIAEDAACGTTWLDAVNADGTTRHLNVPDTPPNGSVAGLGTYGSQLAITLTPGCDGGAAKVSSNSLAWYDPSDNAVRLLFGGGVNGGWIDDAVLFGN